MNIFSKILTRFEFSEPTFKNVQNFQILSKVCNCGCLTTAAFRMSKGHVFQFQERN